MDRKLTKGIIDKLAPAEAPFVTWDGGDGGVKGFGLVVHPTGRKVFLAQYRIGRGRAAKLKRVTIGTLGVFTVDTARAAARKRIEAARQGVDIDDRDAAISARDRRISTLAERFLEMTKAKRKPATIKLYGWIIARHILPVFGHRDATDPKLADAIEAWHAGLAATPSTANRALATLAAILNHGNKRKLLGLHFDNPATDVERYAERKKPRWLDGEELGRLGAAIRLAETEGVPWQPRPGRYASRYAPHNRNVVLDPWAAAALRLLILTGARLREILNLQWSEVDIEAGLLRLADSKTGPKEILLNPPARAVLAGLERSGRYVVKAAGEDRPRLNLEAPLALVLKAAGITGVTAHTLRHSFASVGAAEGHGLIVLGKLLGHAEGSRVTARYAHLANDPVRRAGDAIANSIAASMGDAPTAAILPFKRNEVA